jgi:hypothetical protein
MGLVSGSVRPQDPVVLGRDGVLSCPAQSGVRDYDDPVTRSIRRGSLLGALLTVVLFAAACGSSNTTPTSAASSAPPSVAPSPAPVVTSPPPAELTPVPGGETASPPGEPGSTPTQTDTAWGRIWDAVPDSFPRPAGSTPADSIAGPVSAAFSVGAGAQEATSAVKAGLDAAGYTTDQSGPLEDGSFVLDSTGTRSGCLVQTTLAPQSGTTLMTVMYGAGCPFE